MLTEASQFVVTGHRSDETKEAGWGISAVIENRGSFGESHNPKFPAKSTGKYPEKSLAGRLDPVLYFLAAARDEREHSLLERERFLYGYRLFGFDEQ